MTKVTKIIDQYNKIGDQLQENNDHSICEQYQATRKIEVKAAQTSDPIMSREMLNNGAMNAQLVRYIIQLLNNQKLA